jgi:hypothetical protein
MLPGLHGKDTQPVDKQAGIEVVQDVAVLCHYLLQVS